MAGRRKGSPKTGGRQAGTPNKTTVTVKAALLEAFEKLGGIDSLVAWATANPTEFYKLLARLLPFEANINHSGRMTLEDLIRQSYTSE